MDVQEAIDRLEISQQLNNYAYAVDFGDWDLYRGVFTSDADLDYSLSVPWRGDPEFMIERFEPSFAGISWSQHYITNISYNFIAKNVCAVKAFFYYPCKFPFMDAPSHYYGYYTHEFVRTESGWKSRHLVEVPLQQINPASGEAARARRSERDSRAAHT